jgi:hypothetical protein
VAAPSVADAVSVNTELSGTLVFVTMAASPAARR